MSEAAFEKSYELRGLLLPLSKGNLLLPNAAVVEVLSYPEVTASTADLPDWVLGRFDWRSLSLPLISWDHLLDQEMTEDKGQRKRVAVCHLFSTKKKRSFVGVEVRGMPSLVSVTEADLQAEADSADTEACILGSIRMQDVMARIPDLDGLGKLLSSLG